MRTINLILILVLLPILACAGTAYIPMWQHGLGVSYYNIVINSDIRNALAEINLYDEISSTTYTESQLIAPMDAWQFDTWGVVRSPGLGWGTVTSTGVPGTSFSWGSIYGTVSGKITGITVTNPTKGFTGTGYIPLWQHGYGMTFFNRLINTDTAAATCSINLIDSISSATYSDSVMIAPGGTHAFSAPPGTVYGFGWGFVTSTGAPDTMISWGTTYTTLAGKVAGFTVETEDTGFTDKGIIPIWQHGYGMRSHMGVLNTDTKSVTCEINLIDVTTSTTHTQSQIIDPIDAWTVDSSLIVTGSGYGWGYMTSTGDPGTAIGWSSVYCTLAGRVTGLTVLVPETGF